MLSLLPGLVYAGGGPLGIDSELPLDTGGIWARKYQTGIENGVIAVEIVGALWFGNDDKLGHTFWQDIDSTTLSGVDTVLAVHALIKVITRMHGSKVVAAKAFRAVR